MSDRIDEIRQRASGVPVELVGPPELVAAFTQKDEDIKWLLAEVERLRSPKKYRMNVTMVNDGRKY